MYSSCSRVERYFKREERNVFIHSLIYSVKGPGPLLHTTHCAMHFKCNALQWRYSNLKYQAKICLLGIHMLVIIFMCFVCGRRAGKGKINI